MSLFLYEYTKSITLPLTLTAIRDTNIWENNKYIKDKPILSKN